MGRNENFATNTMMSIGRTRRKNKEEMDGREGDMDVKGVDCTLTVDRSEWKKRRCCTDFTKCGKRKFLYTKQVLNSL